jgi:hypothetical protein
MRHLLMVVTLLCTTALAATPTALAGGGRTDGPPSLRDRVEELQQELDSLTEEVDDLQEPVAEFELFDQCAYPIGVTQSGRTDGTFGYFFGQGGRKRRPALAFDIRGFGRAQYEFLAFPAEEPPSIECNEDAGQEFIDG